MHEVPCGPGLDNVHQVAGQHADTPIRVLIGEGVRRVREEAGRAQADVARLADGWYGLAWNRARVASIEAGQKPISVDELAALLCILSELAGRRVTFADLVEKRRLVALAPGRALYSQALPLLLESHSTADDLAVLADALEAAEIPAPVGEPTVRPVPARARPGPVPRAANPVVPRVIWSNRPDEADRGAAGRLGCSPAAVQAASAALWGSSLAAQRDRLVAERIAPDARPRSRQAVRGLVTRQLVEQLAEHVGQSPPE